MDLTNLQKLTKLIRYYILTMTTNAGSGHATSSLSAVELMTALMFGGFFKADLDNPQNPNNDRLIFSKGHASPLFYSLYAAAGKLTLSDMMNYRKFSSPLEGHPTLEFPYTEAPTGSLGQGLSIGLGVALALRAKLPTTNYQLPTTYVLLGDGEMAEGSMWEAIQATSYNKVDNLVAILDVNRLGQSQPTMFGHDLKEYQNKFTAFGWQTIVVENGHDLKLVLSAFEKLKTVLGRGKPVVIIAKTFKGAGIKILQDKDNWHGKPLPKDLYDQVVKELGEVDLKARGIVRKPVIFSSHTPKLLKLPKQPSTHNLQPITYNLGDSISTRQAAGDALTELMYKYQEVVALDGDVKNSLFTESTQKAHPERFFEMFIAEQNMVGTAIGLSRRGFIPFVTTFSAFMTRAYDQIRMATLAKANIKFIGSHAGVSIGEDGASQMGLEDLSMFRSVFGSTVLYPADAVSAQKLMEEMIKKQGICYLRVGRPATSVIYKNEEKFPVGGSKVHRVNSRHSGKRGTSASRIRERSWTSQEDNKVMIVAAGITLYESLKAQEILAKENLETIVVDCYSIKPIDSTTLISLARAALADSRRSTPGVEARELSVVTVEDHWFEGGLGDAVLNVFSTNPKVKIYKLAVTKLPHSGKPAELLDYEGISAMAIVKKVREVLK